MTLSKKSKIKKLKKNRFAQIKKNEEAKYYIDVIQILKFRFIK